MLDFDFLEKGLGIDSPPHFVYDFSPPYFVYDFSRKMFLVLYFINWRNFTVWLPLLLEILANMCIVIVYFPRGDITNFEIDLTFLIKRFLHMTK